MGKPSLHQENDPSEPLRRRSGFELRTWLFAFPVIGGVVLGVVGRHAYQQADRLGVREWLSIGFALILGLAAVVLPPTIALRELRRRQLDREDADD